MLDAGGFERVEIDAVRAARDRHDAHAGLAQAAEHQEVARVLDQHRVTRSEIGNVLAGVSGSRDLQS